MYSNVKTSCYSELHWFVIEIPLTSPCKTTVVKWRFSVGLCEQLYIGLCTLMRSFIHIEVIANILQYITVSYHLFCLYYLAPTHKQMHCQLATITVYIKYYVEHNISIMIMMANKGIVCFCIHTYQKLIVGWQNIVSISIIDDSLMTFGEFMAAILNFAW